MGCAGACSGFAQGATPVQVIVSLGGADVDMGDAVVGDSGNDMQSAPRCSSLTYASARAVSLPSSVHRGLARALQKLPHMVRTTLSSSIRPMQPADLEDCSGPEDVWCGGGPCDRLR